MGSVEIETFSLVVVKLPVDTEADSEFIGDNVVVTVIDEPELTINAGDDWLELTTVSEVIEEVVDMVASLIIVLSKDGVVAVLVSIRLLVDCKCVDVKMLNKEGPALVVVSTILNVSCSDTLELNVCRVEL